MDGRILIDPIKDLDAQPNYWKIETTGSKLDNGKPLQN